MLLLKLCKAIDIFLKFGKFNKYFALLLLRGHMLQFTKKTILSHDVAVVE